MILPTPSREYALQLLQQVVGPDADFREGQWEAIEALVIHRARLLVVQRTGWGKSVVYFLSTRLLRDQGAGPTILVSPLLALMRNQIVAAEKLGIRAMTINSTNPADWVSIEDHVRAGDVDVLLISPERFANEKFQTNVLIPLAESAGLFVVDEAHCISDWGHDFRPDYRRIVRVLQRLPANIPVCATTATANNRVVKDITSQLGSNLQVSRGPLVRESLRLQTVPLANEQEKLAWLAYYIPRFPGNGIIYALTVRWTNRIAQWLQDHQVDAVAYSADLSHEERLEREQQLLNNQIKVLVATSALGMGYDKPDLSFVIHFHQPGSVVHYYQQVGRAGRAIPQAIGVMLAGGDDTAINDYFIDQAFPREDEVLAVLKVLDQSENGLSLREIEPLVNLSYGRIERVLKTLGVESSPPIALLNNRWVPTAYVYDAQRRQKLVEHMTAIRREEQAQMHAYLRHPGCLMEFLAKALDDPEAGPCGRCAACKQIKNALRKVSPELTTQAQQFLQQSDVVIESRRQWQANAMPIYGWRGNIPREYQAAWGRALCLLHDTGWGDRVQQGIDHNDRFADVLFEAVAAMIHRWNPNPRPTWLTSIPSLNRPQLVPDFADRLAKRLNIPFIRALRKTAVTAPQKQMQNSWHQSHNLDGAFVIDPFDGITGPVFLVDDVVNSRWTFTVAAALLRQAGSTEVFPVALAATR